jgi:hypothetical protein
MIYNPVITNNLIYYNYPFLTKVIIINFSVIVKYDFNDYNPQYNDRNNKTRR